MDEEKEKQEVQEQIEGKEQKETVEESPKEEKNITPLLDNAKETAGRIEAANVQTAKLLEKQEKMLAESALAGRSLAGNAPEQKKKATDLEYAKSLMAGEVLD